MLDEIKKIKSDRQDLKKFGITMGVILCLLGLLLWWRGREIYPYLLAGGAIFLLLGWSAPLVLKPIQKVWMTLALILGWIMTRIILSVLFFIVFVPIGWIARIFGKEFLDQKFDPKADSYWIRRDSKKTETKEAYEKQF